MISVQIRFTSLWLRLVRIAIFKIVDREKEVIRLSEGSKFDIKNILPEACDRAVIALKRFAGISESHGAELRAVATSAVREATNKNEFIKRVLDETGVEIEVIDGLEEARLIYLGVLKSRSDIRKQDSLY